MGNIFGSQTSTGISPVSAFPSMFLPSPGMPAPACLLPASIHVLTTSQVCTQLGSDQLHVSAHLDVQSSSHAAVDGPSTITSCSSQCKVSGVQHANSVASSASDAACLAASAALTPAPAISAPSCTLTGHSSLQHSGHHSLQHLPAATGRPPGSSDDTAVSPCPSPALALLVRPVQLGLSPSKRRLSFPLGPKLAKRFKLALP